MTRTALSHNAHLLMIATLCLTCAAEQPVQVTIHPHANLPDIPPFSSELIGFNLPAGHTREQTAGAAVRGPNTNGVWEALKALNPGLIRVWTSAYESGLDTMQLPPYDPQMGTWQQWLQQVLGDDSPHWKPFDEYMSHVATLGDDVAVMLCIPAFPPWLGPFRAPSPEADLAELIDLRSGRTVPYGDYPAWAGLQQRQIADSTAFQQFAPRAEAFVQRLIEHCLQHETVGPAVRYVSVGNEPENPEKTPRYVCWRLWVYGPENSRKMTAKQPLTLVDEGALQQLYLRVYQGVRAVAPPSRIAVGGPDCAWAHTQRMSRGAFYYLDYFIRGGHAYYPEAADAVEGITTERLDFISYHSYSVRPEQRFRHAAIVSDLYDAYGVPVYLTEYNATAAGHGMNMMQRGALAVADAMITLARHPHARGAAFFKGAGGGFGLVLRRSNGQMWYTGAYWTMKLFSEWFVGGQPVKLEAPTDWEVDGLAVRHSNDDWAAVIINRSDNPVPLQLIARPAPDAPLQTQIVALPIAEERNDYRHVPESDISRAKMAADELEHVELPPYAVIFLKTNRQK